MRRILMFAAGFIAITLSFTSCEQSCKVCQQNTYINGVLDQEGSPSEYCDTDLTAIESTPDFVLGNQVTKWECH